MQTDDWLEDDDTVPIDTEIAETIEEIQSENLVLINGDTRTWEVTTVADRNLTEEPNDERLSKRGVRLQSTSGSDHTVVSLILEEYPDEYRAACHVLETDRWYEEDQVFEIESVELLETVIPWVVVRSGSIDTYHFPDPLAAAHGEAVPAYGGVAREDIDDVDHRFVRINTVYPAQRACMDCACRHRPRELPKLNCPDCGRVIGQGVLHGSRSDAVDGLSITCPGEYCDFEGVINPAE